VFTLDGSLPMVSSSIYTAPIAMPFGGTILANTLTPLGLLGALAAKSFPGCAPTSWTILAVDSEETSLTNGAAANAVDGNPSTLWSTRSNADLALPHSLTIDMSTSRWLGGFTYLPRQDGLSNGIVAQYRFETSADSLNWITNITAGTFNNLPGYLDARSVAFTPEKARFFRFTALQEINGSGWTTAAELSVLPAGFDAWRRDLGLQTGDPLSDADGNGSPLLLEYFRGIIPGAVTNATLVAGGLSAGSFQFDVRRQPGRFDLTQAFETSTNLVNWMPATGVVTNTISLESDGTETLHLSMPAPSGPAARFLRLVIARN
jgi:F5/8 type C domain